MIHFSGSGVLLDVEGATSAVAYVYDVMFPYARQSMAAYLDVHWDDPEFTSVQQQVAADTNCRTAAINRRAFEAEIVRLMDLDVKATGLKQLQGLVWETGFRSGELLAHVFNDVPPALSRWREAGLDVRIYSSGSVHAQRLFFGNTEAGDLLHHLSGHYDTQIGGKRESDSYTRIAEDWRLKPANVLFLSDIVEELEAAKTAGMQTGLCIRPGNAEVEAGHGHAEIHSFDEVTVKT